MENNTEEKKEVEKIPMRQVLIETDGNAIHLVKAEVNGKIELVAVLQRVIDYLNK